MQDIFISIGFEFEFYVDSPDEDIHNIINNDKISIKKEKDLNQYEVITIHSTEINEIIILLNSTKKKLYDLYKKKIIAYPYLRQSHS
ncbi:MAG: hypothetical protein OEY79_00795 [Anaplasmataceae bacterium]|nr:hypothetical protein [Anaplasmataceae bacterium]